MIIAESTATLYNSRTAKSRLPCGDRKKFPGTGAVITTTTGAEGIFRFNSLVPAIYNLTIKSAAGFKTYQQSNIEVTASEVRDLGRIPLTLGAITEQVSVTAAATPIQTASGEN